MKHRIIIASNNKNKVKEISDMLKDADMVVQSLDDIGFKKEIKETGETLKENAAIKARAVAAHKNAKGATIISDDSGLEVCYLANAPGVYSARFAGPGCNYIDNNRKLLKLMKGVPKKERKAVFRTCVYIVFPDGTETWHEGRVEGYISEKMKGKNGFGYDPVFYWPKAGKTFAQMSPAEKNKISHRKRAVQGALKLIIKKLKL